jgi:UDP-GlcNAc:undecaprenyl-phosphate GlcNAc-1-phosphate transferase
MSGSAAEFGAGMVAVLAATISTAGVRAFARRAGIVSAPNPIVPQHTRAVAYLGGIGVAAGAAVGIASAAVMGVSDPAPTVLVAGALFFLGLGTYDDLRPLRPAHKFGLQIAAALTLALCGLTPAVNKTPAIDVGLASLVLVVAVNAVNLTDVCDGLVAGLAALALACWGLLDPSLRAFAWSGAGACLGFLVFNRPPASIFLGDAGSHMLGFALAGLILLSVRRHGDGSMLAAGAIASGVFLFELGFLVVVRARKGLPFWRGSPDHFSLRLQARGLTRAQTDTAAWTAGAACAAAALRFNVAGPGERLALVATLLIAAAWAARAILPWEVRPVTARIEPHE